MSAFRNFERAFSLTELVVALGITTAMAAIMINIVVNLLDTAQRAGGSLLASNQAKVALDFIAQDLQSVAMVADTNVWLAATVQPDQAGAGDIGGTLAAWSATSGGATKPGNASGSLELTPTSERLEDYRFGMAGVWLRLITTEPDSNADTANYSALRATAYQIVRYNVTTTSGASLRYGLFRSWVRPYDGAGNSAFEVGFDLFHSDYNTPAGTVQQGDPASIRRPRRELVLANNVIDFGVRFWRRETNGELTLLFPATSAGVPSDDNLGLAATTDASLVPPMPTTGAPTLAQMRHAFPNVAEIFLRVLSDEGAKVLEAYERNPTPGLTWWDVALANSEVFTRRVEMKGKTL